MKNLIILLVLMAAAGCKKSETTQAVSTTLKDMKSGDTQPVHYVESLQKDVHKAEETADKANAAIQQGQQEVDSSLKAAGE